ncbi:BMP family ABC transporter substrate-binding protein, partial [Clostridioides difficile]|nr:BMP family ABC transporter substrate-binding protein [Clostridioides difficile]
MKRKVLAAILSMGVIAAMAGCSSGQKEAAATTGATTAAATEAATTAAETAKEAASGGGSHKVYLITMDQMDQHWVNVDAGAQKAVKELGNVDYKWLAPDVKDDAKQIECINNAVAGGAQAI